jgi:hypothetical protein
MRQTTYRRKTFENWKFSTGITRVFHQQEITQSNSSSMSVIGYTLRQSWTQQTYNKETGWINNPETFVILFIFFLPSPCYTIANERKNKFCAAMHHNIKNQGRWFFIHFWGSVPYFRTRIYYCIRWFRTLYRVMQYTPGKESLTKPKKKVFFLTLESTRRRVSVAVYTTTRTNRRVQITWISPKSLFIRYTSFYPSIQGWCNIIIFHLAVRLWNLGHNNNTI